VPATDDEISQVRAAAQRTLDVGGLSDIHFGVQYDQRGKAVDNTDSAFVGLADGSLSAPFQSTGISQTPFGFPAISTYDAADMFNSGIYNLVYNMHSNVLANDYSVNEKLLMAFLEFGVDSTLFNVPVTGNFGVRIVNTDQSSDGTSIKHGNTQQNSGGRLVKVPYSDGDKYTDFLPSMNLNFAVSDDKVVRLGIARALARAAIDDMRASRTVQYNAAKAQNTDINDAPWGGGGGNPLLRPWISNQIDLSYEHYFPETRGYWAVAAYYKDLETYIFNDQILVDFTGFPAEPPPVLNEGLVNRPQNGEGGELYGIEFSIQIPGEMLTPSLTGFGAVFNASATESAISTNPSVPDESRLPGLSEEVVNATLYYERYGFSARVSSTFRSDFLQRIQGLGGLNNRMVKAEQIVSAQVGYRFASGSLAGLNIFLQGQNLTDRVRHVYFERDPRLANTFNLYGRTFLFGASYRL
jgi:iron complex outermembrane receptor protein